MRQVQEGEAIGTSGFLEPMIGVSVWRFSSEIENRSGKREEKALLATSGECPSRRVQALEIVNSQQRLDLSLSVGAFEYCATHLGRRGQESRSAFPRISHIHKLYLMAYVRQARQVMYACPASNIFKNKTQLRL
jgi:hypothetical protein